MMDATQARIKAQGLSKTGTCAATYSTSVESGEEHNSYFVTIDGVMVISCKSFDDAFNEYHRVSAKQRREKIAGLEQELAFLTKAEG